jgi:hypothetical protein
MRYNENFAVGEKEILCHHPNIKPSSSANAVAFDAAH